MIVYGTRKFGWVDEVEGLGIVATTFVHVMFVPLIPIACHIMLDDDRGIPIPIQWKSVLFAWARSAVFWSAAASWVGVPFTGITCCLAVPLTLAYLVMPLAVRRASDARAAELRALARG